MPCIQWYTILIVIGIQVLAAPSKSSKPCGYEVRQTGYAFISRSFMRYIIMVNLVL